MISLLLVIFGAWTMVANIQAYKRQEYSYESYVLTNWLCVACFVAAWVL